MDLSESGCRLVRGQKGQSARGHRHQTGRGPAPHKKSSRRHRRSAGAFWRRLQLGAKLLVGARAVVLPARLGRGLQRRAALYGTLGTRILRLDGTEVSQEILGRERCRPLADLPGTGLDDPPLAFGRLGEVHTTNGERTDTPASANWLTSMSTPALGVRGFVGEPEARLGLDAGGSQEAAQQCATGPGRAAGQVRLDRTYRDHLVS